MNISKSFSAISLFVLISYFQECIKACPCGSSYNYYYVIAASGKNKDTIMQKGRQLALQTKNKFVSDDSNREKRAAQCKEDPENCFILLSSDDEAIGKQGWTDSDPKKEKTYAIAYLFDSFNTKKNQKRAVAHLKKVKTWVADAYIKLISACACE